MQSFYRGISSVVRRCIDKETGREYAAKIIDIGAADANDPQQMLEATRQEISILRQVMGHAFISKLLSQQNSINLLIIKNKLNTFS